MGDANAFDADTAVRDEPIPREARPTDAIDALDRLPRADGTRPSTTSFEVVTAVNQLPLPREALRTNALVSLEPPPLGNEATSNEPPQADPASRADKVAEQRGLQPIARPRLDRPGVSRGWLYLAACVSLTSAAIAASAVVSTRGEVQRGSALRAAPIPPIRASTAANPEPPRQPVVAKHCTLRVGANVRGALVAIDGVERGTAPAEVSIECGHETTINVRRARYEDFTRKLSIDGGAIEISAKLERQQTELSVSSEPVGATVIYNGRVLGKTPLVTKVDRYERATLRLRAPGMASLTRKLVLDEPAEAVTVELRRRR